MVIKISFKLKDCLDKTEDGKDLCNCLKIAEFPRACIRNYLVKDKNRIGYIFGSMCSGKSEFWKENYADPNFVDVRGNLEGINEEQLEGLKEENKDEGAIHPVARKFFSTHDISLIKGEKTYFKDSIQIPKGVGFLIERDNDKVLDCLKKERPVWKEKKIFTMEKIIEEKKDFRDFADKNKAHDIFIMENLK